MTHDTSKVRVNRGGATVLACESGNPSLGVMLTPDPAGLIVCLPTGQEPRHALDSVAVVLGAEQCGELAVLAARYVPDRIVCQPVACPSCRGTGQQRDGARCALCHGSGREYLPVDDLDVTSRSTTHGDTP